MTWSSLGSIHDIIHNTDLILFIEIHESVVKGIPPIIGYSWISTFRTSTHPGTYEHGSGGVAFLIRDGMHHRMRVEGIETRTLYLAISRETIPSPETLHSKLLLPPRDLMICHPWRW